jgi:S1-C subfamily serine protease
MSVEIGRSPMPFSGNVLPPDWQDRVLQFQERLRRRLEGRDAPRPGAAGAPVLGINVQDVSGQLGAYLKVPEGQGVLITNVQAGSAAERGGLQAGDVIIAVDGQRVRNTAELRAQVRATAETRTAALRVVRNGVEMTVNVAVSAAPRPGARANEPASIPI